MTSSEFGTFEYLFSILFDSFANKPLKTFRRRCEWQDGYWFGGWWLPEHWLLPLCYEIFCSGMTMYELQNKPDFLWYVVEKTILLKNALRFDEGTIRAYLGVISD